MFVCVWCDTIRPRLPAEIPGTWGGHIPVQQHRQIDARKMDISITTGVLPCIYRMMWYHTYRMMVTCNSAYCCCCMSYSRSMQLQRQHSSSMLSPWSLPAPAGTYVRLKKKGVASKEERQEDSVVKEPRAFQRRRRQYRALHGGNLNKQFLLFCVTV